MATVSVQCRYLTGLKRQIFRNARLWGSWDEQGRGRMESALAGLLEKASPARSPR